jgi:hypothetical protein
VYGVAYREFKDYYGKQRSRCSLENANRVFHFAIAVYRAEYAGVMDLWQFLGCVYDTLGYGPADGETAGLFATFDPTLYQSRDVAKHFLNVFSKKLRYRLKRCLHPYAGPGTRRTDQNRKDEAGFRPGAVLGFVREYRLPEALSRKFGPQRLLESLPDRQWPPRGLASLAWCLFEAYELLDDWELDILRCAYAGCKAPSLRKMGRCLGLDHKTVRRRLHAALAKLKVYFGDEIHAAEQRALPAESR